MQWAGRLIAVPLGKTNLERALARERRKVIADGYMLPLMGVSVWTLLLSIGFFVIGFLIQLWELALSFSGSAPILIIGGVFATGLSLVILGIIVITTVHAALNDNSPFESPLSNAMQPLLQWIRQNLRLQGANGMGKDGWKDKRWGQGDSAGSVEDTDNVEALTKWEDNDGENVKALKTYARLVLNTNDTEALERAVPSFEFRPWYRAGDSLFPILMAVRERFLATDTSFRVKETVHRQTVYFKDWNGWKRYGRWRDN